MMHTYSAYEAQALEAYVRSARWRLTYENELYSVWSHDGRSEFLQVVIPRRHGSSEFDEMMLEALSVVAHLEGRPVVDVASGLQYGAADSVRVRYVPKALAGEAPLPMAFHAHLGLRQWVLGAACALELDGQVIPSRRPRLAKQFVDSVRVSTEPGSYILRAMLPLLPAQGSTPSTLPALTSTASIGRVSERMEISLRHGLACAERARTDGLDVFVEADAQAGTEAPLNTSELDGLANLAEEYPYQVKFGGSMVLDRKDRLTRQVYSVESEAAETFRAAAEYLRKLDREVEREITGSVVGLDREGNSGPGEIKLLASDDDSGRPHKVRMGLNEADYNRAIQAHRDGARIRANGTLVRQKNRRELIGLSKFEVLAPRDERLPLIDEE